MEIGDAATADEVILAFLMAEFDADRYGATIRQLLDSRGLTESLILHPDLTSDRENQLRAEILAQYRGWGTDAYLFKGFPAVIEWHRARLSPNDAREMLYANSPEWVALSGGSRRIGDGASTAARTPAVSDPTGTVSRINAVANLYRQGLVIQPPIVVTTPIRHTLIAVEGHTRLTAWCWQNVRRRSKCFSGSAISWAIDTGARRKAPSPANLGRTDPPRGTDRVTQAGERPSAASSRLVPRA